VAETACTIVQVLNEEDGGVDAAEVSRVPLFSWDERLNMELDLYDSLFEKAR
jgi:hypothetical protein